MLWQGYCVIITYLLTFYTYNISLMRILLSFLFVIAMLQSSIAQMEPVQWSFEVEQVLAHVKKETTFFIRELETDNVAYHAIYMQAFREKLKQEFGERSSVPIPASWISTSRRTIPSQLWQLQSRQSHQVHHSLLLWLQGLLQCLE